MKFKLRKFEAPKSFLRDLFVQGHVLPLLIKVTFINNVSFCRVEWHFTVPPPLRSVLAQLTHTALHIIF